MSNTVIISDSRLITETGSVAETHPGVRALRVGQPLPLGHGDQQPDGHDRTHTLVFIHTQRRK